MRVEAFLSRNTNPFDYKISRIKGDWDGFSPLNGHIDRTKFTQEQKEAVRKEIMGEDLPRLIANPELNRSRIALALSFVNSQELPTEIRVTLGLNQNFQGEYRVDNCPKLFDPLDYNIRWGSLCVSSEQYLEAASVKQDKIAPLFDIDGCLKVKAVGIVAGLCYKTTDFPNGSSFIEGVWYILRDYDLFPKIVENAEHIRNLHPERISKLSRISSDHISIKNDEVHWQNFGGIWQPARAFASPFSIDSKKTNKEVRKYIASLKKQRKLT